MADISQYSVVTKIQFFIHEFGVLIHNLCNYPLLVAKGQMISFLT